MRSLWKQMALRWLGGRASQRLTGDSRIDALMAPVGVRTPTFLVARRCEASPYAIMAQPDRDRTADQRAIDEALAGAIDKSNPL
jgi:hypothetical protein